MLYGRIRIHMYMYISEIFFHTHICTHIHMHAHAHTHTHTHTQLRQYGIKLLVLWLQALQENASDACMELFASAVPHFPPVKTPLGLPVGSPSPSPTPSALSLCERYGTYSSTSLGLDSQGSTTPLLPPPSLSSSGYSLAGASASKGLYSITVCVCVYMRAYV